MNCNREQLQKSVAARRFADLAARTERCAKPQAANARPIKRFALFAAWISLGVMSGAIFAADAPSNRRERETYERYTTVYEHNIFMKQRPVKPATKPAANAGGSSSRTTEESLVLRGIAYESTGFRAYVEDLNNGKELRLIPGDAVGRGHITEVDIDRIAYERNGEEKWIDVGCDFTGKEVVTVTETSADEGPTTGPVQTIDPNNPNLSLEERMKLRRQQERKQ
jgi:hypothetical protein